MLTEQAATELPGYCTEQVRTRLPLGVLDAGSLASLRRQLNSYRLRLPDTRLLRKRLLSLLDAPCSPNSTLTGAVLLYLLAFLHC